MAVRGHVDGMVGAYVIGWAVSDADSGNCAIEILDPAGTVLAKGRASRHRDDLVSLGLGRTTMAFRIPVNIPAAPGLLRVLADGEELAGSPIKVGTGQFDGDAMVSAGAVSGWVTERFSDFPPPLITVVNQHGALVGKSRATRDPDETDKLAAAARFTVELADACFGAGELRLSVLANGVKLVERSCHLGVEGNLEMVAADRCSGWLLSPDQPKRSFEIEVYRDGVLAGTATCDLAREDVRAVFPGCGTPGFSVTLKKPVHEALEAVTLSLRFPGADVELFQGPYVIGSRPAAVAAAQRAARLAYYGMSGIGAAERAVLQLALVEYIKTARRGQGFTAARQPDPVVPFGEKPRLTIIVPVYRGIAETRDCLASVLAHRNPATDQLVVINDASPDEIMAPMLAQLVGMPNVFVLTNETNLGFVQTVNRGIRFAAGSDVLLLNADTVLFAGGLNELCRVAYAAAEIGTVTAMSNNATIFSYPHPSLCTAALADIGWADLAAAALAENAGMVIEVPTGHGFCLFIKGEVVRRLGLLDEAFGRGYGEENDFCARAADLGYQHVAAAGVIVEHRESISFSAEKAALMAVNLPRLNGMYPEYTAVIMDFERQDGLRSARWALDRVRLRGQVAAGRAFVLLITNALDGGTVKAISDIEWAASYGAATRLTLRCRDDGFMELTCADPVLQATFSPREVAGLFALIGAAQPTHLVAHQLLGFPAAFIERLGEFAADLHSVFYAHDYYALCPRVTMIDAVGRFCDVADTETCARCVAMGGAHETSKLNALSPQAHREMFDDLLRAFRRVVVPSASAASYLERAFPGVAFEVVPHPESAAGVAAAARAGSDDEILLLGAIGPHKGSARLLEIAQRARLTHPHLSFRVIGFTDIDRNLTAIGNVTITGRYRPEQLPTLIAQTRGRLALFLHAWPETYSYTLSEVAKYGFVPLVPEIGAPAARVRAAGYGAVFPFPFSAEQVLGLIDDIAAGRVQAVQPGAGPAALYPDPQTIALTRQILGLRPEPAAAPAPPPAPAPLAEPAAAKPKRRATAATGV
jgi:GT2 family glycosyltransferase/glycosyltransferase involved in cell wall biosynthesis